MPPEFVHELLEPIHLPRIEEEGKRYYQTPEGKKLPSVTTVLKDHYKNDLSAWKERIGEDQARAIIQKAKVRGTRLHKLCELFLLNETEYLKSQFSTTIADFNSIKLELLKRVGKIYGIEFPLYSNHYNCAGTADLICNWAGIPSIVDFKTSLKNKREEWIESYFVQATIYGLMTKELFGLDIRQIVIVLLVENDNPRIIIKNINDYVEKVNEVFLLNTVCD